MIPQEIIDWDDFLTQQGMSNIVDMDEWIMCNCPFHNQSDKSRPSFGIYKENGDGNCFGCGKHPWEEFCNLVGISAFDFIDGMRENAWKSFKRKMLKHTEKILYKRYKLPNSLSNPLGHKGCAEYFLKRGIQNDILEIYNVRLCLDETSKYNEYVIFPIYDEKGILFFDARYVGNKIGKQRWRRPIDAPVWKTFFNWVNIKNYGYICLVEGATDALKLIQFGLKNTIPAKNFSPSQITMILRAGFKYMFLCYDEDEAGRHKFNKKGWDISFNGKAKFLFNDAGINLKEIVLPEYAKDPAEIKNHADLIGLNPLLEKFS